MIEDTAELLGLGMTAVPAYFAALNLLEVPELDFLCARVVRHLDVRPGSRRTAPEVDGGGTAVVEDEPDCLGRP